jgi:hypothetical protein
MSATQSEAFKTAAEDSKKLTSKPDNDELLQLYGMTSPLTLGQARIVLNAFAFQLSTKLAAARTSPRHPARACLT